MASVQDRLKIKRESCDTWSTREQLCLASSVLKSGDQNWISVSRSLKPFAEKEALRPPDWFSQKSCAIQYGILLENADTPKRKKRESGETTGESIVRRLRQERIAELGQILAFQRDEYQQLKAEVNLLKSAAITDEKLQKMWIAIEQEEREQEQKSRAHSVWLAKRQLKLDATPSQITPLSTPKKIPDNINEITESIDTTINSDDDKKNRGGQTALLTSLLTSPSPTTQLQNTSTAQVTSPTIASLLGSNTKIHTAQPSPRMSPQLHQLVTSTISTTTTTSERPSAGAPTLSMLLALPANLSRGTLSNLQTTTIQTSATDIVTTPSRLSMNKQVTQNNSPVQASVVSVTSELAETESMVQIIDQIDDVIGKDKITDVIDKDEINEIIGDIEELIKEEITGNLQTNVSTSPATRTTPVPNEECEKVQEGLKCRNVDETVSLSSSPDSKMAVENIHQSSTNIAKIIGTTIESRKAKAIANTILKSDTTIENKSKELSPAESVEKKNLDEDLTMETETTTSIPKNKEKVNEEEKESKNIDNKDINGEMKESDGKTAQVMEKSNNKIIEEETEKQEIESTSMGKEEFEKITREPNVPEKKNKDEDFVKLKEEEMDNIKGKFESAIEKKKDLPAMELIKDECVKLEIKEVQQPTEITKNEEMICEQSIGISNSQKLKEEKISNCEETVKNENLSQNDEELIKSTIITENKKEEEEEEEEAEEEEEEEEGDEEEEGEDDEEEEEEEEGEDRKEKEEIEEEKEREELEESSKKEEINDKIVESSSVLSKLTTISTECENIPVQKIENISSPKSEIHDKLKEVDIKAEDIIVKKEIIEEQPNATDAKEMKIEETESEKTFEVNDTGEIEEKIEVKITKEVGSIIEIDKVKEPMESVEIMNEMEDIKDTKETKEMIEMKETKVTKETNEMKETKEMKEIKIEKPDKPEKLDKTDKIEKDDGPKNDKEEEMMEVKKEEPSTSVVDDTEMEEEESSLTKLSAGRAMKTYSKKQNITLDSEPETESSGEGADYRAWKKAVMLVYNRLATHKYASVFLRPITEDQAPGYHSVIFRPMDLSTIKKNIDNGTIRTTMHFQRDVMLMFQNAIMYNKHDTFVYQMAISMQQECLQHMQILVEVTGEGPFRRETRTAASSSSEMTESGAIKRKRSHITPSPHDTDSPRMKKRRKSENE